MKNREYIKAVEDATAKFSRNDSREYRMRAVADEAYRAGMEADK